VARRNNTPTGNGNLQDRLRQSVEPADWGNANPAIVLAVICAATANDGAVRFGYTRDGGAYAVGILGFGEPITKYIRPHDDLDGELQALAELLRT